MVLCRESEWRLTIPTAAYFARRRLRDTLDRPRDRPRGTCRGPPAGDGRSRMRRVLLTGGAGFMGSQVLRELVAAGCEVVVLDKLCLLYTSPSPRD